MTSFRNDSKGIRGIQVRGGGFKFVNPGQSVTVPGHTILAVPIGLTEIEASEVEGGDELGGLTASPKREQQGLGREINDERGVGGEPIDLLDRDGNGEPGGSLAHEPPALSGMNKAQLIEQAGKEGVDVDAIQGTGSGGKVINADIEAAIEAQRTRSQGHDSDDS